MKTIEEMTHEEKLKLTDIDTVKMVQLRLMENATPIFLNPPMKVCKENFLPKEDTAFVVDGHIFKTKETAQKYVNFLNEIRDELFVEKYDWNLSYSHKWLEPSVSDYNISESKYYKKETVYGNIDRIKNFENESKLIQKEQEKFDKYTKAYNDIHNEIWSQVWRARELQSKVDRYKEIFQEYLKLCDNDKEKAKVFFFKAHILNDDELNLMGIDNENT